MSRREQVLLFAFLVLSVLGMATAYLLLDGVEYQQATVGPAFRMSVSQTVDLERQQVLERMEVNSFELTSDDAALLQGLAELHAAQESLAKPQSGEQAIDPAARWEGYQQNVKVYRKMVSDYTREQGIERYIRLGLFTRGIFLKALRGVTAHLGNSDLQVSAEDMAFIERAVPTIEKLMGSYLDWAVESGMVASSGYARSTHLFTAGLVYKLSWLQWISAEHRMENYLTSFERQALVAYRVEFEPDLEYSERQDLLLELQKNNPGYPIDVMRIITLAKFGRSGDALLLLETALGVAPDNLMLLRLKSLVERRVEEERARETSAPDAGGSAPLQERVRDVHGGDGRP